MLKDKVVIITGCNRGIGSTILETFAANRAIIFAHARLDGSLDDRSMELSNKYNTSIIPVYFDIRDTDAMKATFLRINREYKRLDAVVNNAGIMNDALIGMISEKNMNEIFSVNVFAVINMIQYAAKIMTRQKSGSVINISSIVANGNPGQTVYSASKGAVISLTKTAAKELASKNIRVNAIAPGMIDTDMFRSIGEPFMTDRIAKIGMGRIGTPEDIANTALFLASDLSSYITGQIIGVDGAASV